MTRSPVVLGLDFGGTKIAVALCDLSGSRLGATTVDSFPDDGASAAMLRAVSAGRELLETAAPQGTLAAVGAATFGIPFEDRVELAPTIPGWESLAFGRELKSAFPGVPVELATDVKAAAQAEARWGALVGHDPGLYLNLGTGLAAAIVADGKVVTGAHRAAGEIGYNVRDVSDVEAPLSQRITLEDVVSGKALAAIASAELGRPTTTTQLFEQAASDPKAAALVDEFVRELAMHVVNLAVAVDPARIVVGGGMVRSWARLAPGLRRALDAAVPFPPELVTAEFPFDAPLIGALALGVAAAGAVLGEEALA
ncbi:MAG TPA: ROK family protein [Acidothermaceae bacterium]|nr:ROK family protein [Acidothermaceae bacterium]